MSEFDSLIDKLLEQKPELTRADIETITKAVTDAIDLNKMTWMELEDGLCISVCPDSKVKQIVVVKDGKAKFISVETGYRTTSGVEITSGVQVGDSLIVAGMLFVRDGSDLKIGKTLPLVDIIK